MVVAAEIRQNAKKMRLSPAPGLRNMTTPPSTRNRRPGISASTMNRRNHWIVTVRVETSISINWWPRATR